MRITIKQRTRVLLLLIVYLSVIFASCIHIHANEQITAFNNSTQSCHKDGNNQTYDSHSCFLCDFLGSTYTQEKSFSTTTPLLYCIQQQHHTDYSAVSQEKKSPCTIRGPCIRA